MDKRPNLLSKMAQYHQSSMLEDRKSLTMIEMRFQINFDFPFRECFLLLNQFFSESRCIAA